MSHSVDIPIGESALILSLGSGSVRYLSLLVSACLGFVVSIARFVGYVGVADSVAAQLGKSWARFVEVGVG